MSHFGQKDSFELYMLCNMSICQISLSLDTLKATNQSDVMRENTLKLVEESVQNYYGYWDRRIELMQPKLQRQPRHKEELSIIQTKLEQMKIVFYSEMDLYKRGQDNYFLNAATETLNYLNYVATWVSKFSIT
jgi:hypothetical protein